MPEEHCADQSDHDELQQQLVAEVCHRAINQQAAVVGSHDFHAGRQAFLKLVQLGFHCSDGLASVLTTAQDNHAADRLALAIQLGNSATHLRP
ncbi:hypothetical protein D9M68_552460 [compost metagenome]